MSKTDSTEYPFVFNPQACQSCGGRCCVGKSGYIWATMEELTKMAEYVGIPLGRFLKQYTYREGDRISLREVLQSDKRRACIFYKDGCQIYEVRPEQCRTYPFWPDFKRDCRELCKECPGVTRTQ